MGIIHLDLLESRVGLDITMADLFTLNKEMLVFGHRLELSLIQPGRVAWVHIAMALAAQPILGVPDSPFDAFRTKWGTRQYFDI